MKVNRSPSLGTWRFFRLPNAKAFIQLTLLFALTSTVLSYFSQCKAAEWYVDASVATSGSGKTWETAFKTIQQGINAASHGDAVTVGAGTYLTNVRFYGKNIILRSREPSNPESVADTIIDGGRYGPVVTFSGTEDPTCVLSGFTIRNGSADNGGGICGGTQQNHTHATIRYNVVTGNEAVEEWPHGHGGGVAFCDGLIEHCRFVRNVARRGGGLYQCSGMIRNNVIVGNSGESDGGGLLLCEAAIENNTIVRNSAQLGGGLSYCNGMIRNCIIWGNGGGNQLSSCTVPSYSCIGVWTGGGEGNISFFPYFIDAAQRDYHLRSWSPCIDAGDPTCDFSNETQPNGGRINMGAYGNTSEATSASGDSDGDGLPDDWELLHFGNLAENPDGDLDGDGVTTEDEYFRGLDPNSPAVTWYVDGSARNSGEGTSWETAFRTIQEGIDAAVHGDTIIVSEGKYFENLFVSGKNVVLESADPLDAAVVANTVIDGCLAGSVVAFNGSEDEMCVLAGFTIHNGQSFYGGGIRGEGTRAAIRNNVIANNSAEWNGGGVSGCYGVIENNTISGSDAFEGAGLAYCGGTIRDNVITGNTAKGEGGALYGCTGTFEGNILSGNAAIGGGGLAACEGVFRFNTIWNNSAAEHGGAFAWCSGTFANNVIWENTAVGEGGGFFNCDGEFPNNTVVWNSAQLGGGFSQCYGTILNCILWGNSWESPLYDCDTPRYCCIEDWAGEGEGNINYNPYFVDEGNGDFHLKPCSPCIDAGDPASPFSNEPLPDGGRIDLGAYGNTSEATSKSRDTDGDGLPDDWEMDLLGTLSHDGDDDPDGDEIPNLIEYLYATPPNVAGTSNIVRNLTAKRWFSTIQAALSGAADGDELVVYPGHYVENIHFDGKNVILRSLDPQDPAVVADTIIDGNQNGPVVTFAGTENESCVLSGFTIRNGAAYSGGGIRGGQEYSPTHATIQDNVITSNSAAYGGGIYACDGIIQGNIIMNNSATQDGGGAAFCDGLIKDNIIHGNRAEGQGGGVASSDAGGLYCCNGRIQNNTISGNSANGDGGGLYWCDGAIQNNVITGNSARCVGGGLSYCNYYEVGEISNNTVSGNSADVNGGGVAWSGGTIRNNTIADNRATSNGGGVFNCPETIRNCIIWGNEATEGPQVYNSSGPTYSCIEGWTGGGLGNISYYPYFVDAQGGDYHLRSYSPCIDGGDPASPYSNEPQPNGGRINMGAYGNTPEAACASTDSDGDGLPDDWELHFFGSLAQGPDDDPDEDVLSNLEEYLLGTDPAAAPGWYVDGSMPQTGDGTSWSKAFKTIREGMAAASDGDTVWVAPGIYYENIHFQGKNIILKSKRPDDPEIVASTIIDGQRLTSVVTFAGTEDETCLLWGFTIYKGNAPSGGGVYGDGTTATIRGNIFTSNSATAGAAVASCNGTVERNIISGNSSNQWGGMIWNSNGTVQGNVISDSSGGGLVSCNGFVRNNIIRGNTGDGIYNCGGIVENNTIFRNNVGIRSCKGVIRNCIVWGNSQWQVISYASDSVPTYSCIEAWDKGGVGNISGYPYFVGHEGGDFHLRSWSPCIDAGDPSSDFSSEPNPNGGRINIGAYGNTLEAACPSADTDSDGLPDDWEMHFFGNLDQGASHDPDGDGISNLEEYHHGANPATVVTWYVDGAAAPSGDGTSWETAFRTIQKGIDASFHDDVVVVAEGTYLENIHLRGKNIKLTSKSPLDEDVVANTIIDGRGTGSAVTFGGTEGRTSILSGFTIRNGSADRGGGISGNHTHATIENNVIAGNSAASYGGGLSSCHGTIRNNVVAANSSGYDGGGLYGCDGRIEHNVISANSAVRLGGGLESCNGEIGNNIVSRNSAGKSGGGLAYCDGAIRNNTLTDNRAEDYGGGVCYCDGAILNCIMWRNTAASGPQSYGSVTPTYSCIQNWQEGGEGNISAYPYFVDQGAGDYHLRSWSPCVDAGDLLSDYSNEPAPNGGRINMGAYGNTSESASASEDTDDDLLPDDWERQFFGDLAQGASDDADGDGRSNLEEYQQGTNPASVVTWYVDAAVSTSGDGTTWETAFKTIQRGIDVASDDDVVLVAEGIYLENIYFNGKNITLTSTDPLDPVTVTNTILDGGSAGPVVRFLGTEGQTCIVSGFTIRNGSALIGGGICGGVQHSHTQATIQNNVITGNSARWDGGGLAYCDGAVQNNTIRGNAAEGQGGAAASSGGTLRSNIIEGNTAGGDAGALYDWDGTIQGNRIAGNLCGHGGALLHCDGIIRSNVIRGNFSAHLSAGLYGCDGIIENNVVTGNSGVNSGGGLAYCQGVIRNCIIWGNLPLHLPQVYASSEPTYSCIEDWQEEGEGNISAYPYFVDQGAGDYHLRSWSPCIDAGDPSSDFSNEPQPNGGRINMGAYGNTLEAASASPDTDEDLLPDDWERQFFGDLAQGASDDADGDGRSNRLEYLNGTDPTWFGKWHVDAAVAASGDGTSWQTAFKTIREGIDAAFYGDIVLVAEGTYVENIYFRGKNITLTSTDPLDPAVAAGTVIDGDGSGSAVTFLGTESEACVLSGFTIQNGSADYGGGIMGDGTRATIQNNIISDNSAASDGGGLAFCDGTIVNNTISRNWASYGGGLAGCDGIIQDNIISGNLAAVDGGGLASCHGTIENNTIVGNSAGYEGGGLYNCYGVISNCIIWGNQGGNQVYDSTAPLYCCIEHWIGGGDGNIGYFPYFVDANGGDYHLQTWSPCIDTGDPTSSFSNEPQPDGGRINMGAYGNTPEAASASEDTDEDLLPDDWELHFFGNLAQRPDDDPDGDGRSNLGEYQYGTNPAHSVKWYVDGSVLVSGDGTSWENAFKTIQEGVNAASDGDPVIVAEGTYVENIRFQLTLPKGETIFEEAFDSCTNLYTHDDLVNAGWEVVNGSGNPDVAWRLWNTHGDPLLGEDPDIAGMTENYMITDSDFSQDAEMDEELITPEIDCREWEGVRLHFNKNYRLYDDPENLQIAEVDIRVFAEASGEWGDWINLIHLDRMTGPLADDLIDSDPEQADLSAYADGSVIQLRWHFYDAVWDYWFAIDDILVSGERVVQPVPVPLSRAEYLNSDTKNITLRSRDPSDPAVVQSTIVDGGEKGSVVTFMGTETEACVLAGFTIRNGNAGYGAGIAGNGTHATIRNNMIADNSATRDGGGLFLCNGIVQNNVINGNSSGRNGGGLYDCDGRIHNNIVWGNSAQNLGGGLARCDGTIENNTILGNFVPHEGGGLDGCYGVITNCIVWGNHGGKQVYDSTAPVHSCIQEWTEGGEGNIGGDPRFVDPDSGDYRLSRGSPCIDAGKNEDWMEDAVDLDGNPRIIHGGCSLTVDMGAYEFGYPFRTLQVRRNDAGEVLLIWSSGHADAYYVVWSCLDLLSGEWTQGDAVPSQGKTTTWSDPDETSRQKFYRIEIIGDM